MRKSKFTDAQIAFILKQGEDGTPIGEVCRKAGISQATYYKWRTEYAGLMPSEMKRLKLLEDENNKLGRSPDQWRQSPWPSANFLWASFFAFIACNAL